MSFAKKNQGPAQDRRQLPHARAFHLDRAALVIDRFARHFRVAPNPPSLPVVYHFRPFFSIAGAAETTGPFPCARLDGEHGEEDVLHFQRRNLLHGLADPAFGWDFRAGFREKLLHRGFLPQLVEIGPVPLAAGTVEIRNVNQRERLLGQKRGHPHARSVVRSVKSPPNRPRRHRRGQNQQLKFSHCSPPL